MQIDKSKIKAKLSQKFTFLLLVGKHFGSVGSKLVGTKLASNKFPAKLFLQMTSIIVKEKNILTWHVTTLVFGGFVKHVSRLLQVNLMDLAS